MSRQLSIWNAHEILINLVKYLLDLCIKISTHVKVSNKSQTEYGRRRCQKCDILDIVNSFIFVWKNPFSSVHVVMIPNSYGSFTFCFLANDSWLKVNVFAPRRYGHWTCFCEPKTRIEPGYFETFLVSNECLDSSTPISHATFEKMETSMIFGTIILTIQWNYEKSNHSSNKKR